MANETYETALRIAQELSPEEQRRLLDVLHAQAAPVPEDVQQIRNRLAHSVPLTPEERAAVRAALDRARAQIGAAWTSEQSALEAVQEQRRDL